MSRLADRLLARIVHKTTVHAGCSTFTYCRDKVKYSRTCCLNEGCTEKKIGKC
ncbi:hypothetical protein [Actinomadura roseirufa]|uniref:hypothetical protein n=1 Tax=Actinomadura roseirufa TaxID=2094049 RepID=UPI0013F16D87|nr:hypothetical protein [Actinomadura roseirufa]